MNLAAETVTLGLLAGGPGSRLGGLDKAWLRCHGQPQALRLIERFVGRCGTVLVSANRSLARYAAQGLQALPDRHPGIGPIAGLDALAAGCATPWLFTLPVDALDCDRTLLEALAAAGGQGAVAQDADGLQPLFALYRTQALRGAVADAIAAGRLAVRDLQCTLRMPVVPMAGARFGNLNTPEALAVAGCIPDPDAGR